MTDNPRIKAVARVLAEQYLRAITDDSCLPERLQEYVDACWVSHQQEAADVLEAADAAAWRPIEEAPRDGTRVLVARCHVDDSTISWATTAYYNPRYNQNRGAWETGDSLLGALVQPTHFMPLPTPPGDENE